MVSRREPLVGQPKGRAAQWLIGNPVSGREPLPPVFARLMLRAQSGEPLGRADLNRLAKALRRTSVRALKRELRTGRRTARRAVGRAVADVTGRPAAGRRGGRR